METNKHTAVNISLIHEAFYMPQLHRTRRIWMYRPAGYDVLGKRYPVMYMHDGQNLFDEATAFEQEWCVDETLQSLHMQCIIVGIENSEYRMTEYNYHDHEEQGAGEGRAYMEFIVRTLKPFIDKHYRTLPDRAHTFMAGSSMGGLISLYGALHFPQVFSRLGIFSPSLWIVPNGLEKLLPLVKNNRQYSQQFYFYSGANEGCDMVENMVQTAGLMAQYPQYKIDMNIDPEGEHCEACWRNHFPDFCVWLMLGINETSHSGLN